MSAIFSFFKNYHILRLLLFVIPIIIIIILFEKSKRKINEEIIQVNNMQLPEKWYDKLFRWMGGIDYQLPELDAHLAKKIRALERLEADLSSTKRFELISFILWLILFFIFDLRLRIFKRNNTESIIDEMQETVTGEISEAITDEIPKIIANEIPETTAVQIPESIVNDVPEIVEKANFFENLIRKILDIPQTNIVFSTIGYGLTALWFIVSGIFIIIFLVRTIMAIFGTIEWRKVGHSFLSALILFVFNFLLFILFNKIFEKPLTGTLFSRSLDIVAFALYLFANITMITIIRAKNGKAKWSTFFKMLIALVVIYIPFILIRYK